MIINVTEDASFTELTNKSLVLDRNRISGTILCNFGRTYHFVNDLTWMAIEVVWGLTPLDDGHWVVDDDWAG